MWITEWQRGNCCITSYATLFNRIRSAALLGLCRHHMICVHEKMGHRHFNRIQVWWIHIPPPPPFRFIYTGEMHLIVAWWFLFSPWKKTLLGRGLDPRPLCALLFIRAFWPLPHAKMGDGAGNFCSVSLALLPVLCLWSSVKGCFHIRAHNNLRQTCSPVSLYIRCAGHRRIYLLFSYINRSLMRLSQGFRTPTRKWTSMH